MRRFGMHRARLIAIIAGAIVVAGCGGPAATAPATVGATTPAATATPAIATSSPATPKPPDDVTVRDREPWLAFQWIVGSGDGIFLVRPDGSGRHRVGGGSGGSQIHPDWSPDGRRLAFASLDANDDSAIWIVNADGSGAEQVVSCKRPCNQVSYPDWSADGTAIYFGMDADADAAGIPATFQVGRYDLASGQVDVVLERRDGMTAEQPRISPDGKTLAYTRFKDPLLVGLGSAIFTAPVDGGAETRLTEWSLLAAYPDWSPDGGRILFNTRDLGAFQEGPGAANLFTIDDDGGAPTPLTTFGNRDTRATQPRWTPDGSGIVFTKVDGAGFGTRSLGYVASDGSGLRLFTPSAIDGTHPTLRPIP